MTTEGGVIESEADYERTDGAEGAELAKLAETTYRDVNIALANEFARFADGAGIDVDRVIAAANSQPFSHIHRPGVAVGGHCIPVYPRFYLEGDPQARRSTPRSCRPTTTPTGRWVPLTFPERAWCSTGAASWTPRRSPGPPSRSSTSARRAPERQRASCCLRHTPGWGRPTA